MELPARVVEKGGIEPPTCLAANREPALPLFYFPVGGPDRSRTDRLVVADHALYQMSYRPKLVNRLFTVWLRGQGSNLRP